MLDSMAFVIFLVVIALVFDFLNGFHDSANSISTVVSTRVLSPKHAVIWAAFFNFAAVFFVGTEVAHTIGKGIIHLDIVDNLVILSALGGAIIWNIATWYYGLPSSSSHALIGGLIGAAVCQSRNQHTGLVRHYQNNYFYHCFSGYRYGFGLLLYDSCPESEPSIPIWPNPINSFANFSLFPPQSIHLGHGMNDAQKTMGIIAMALFSKGLLGNTISHSLFGLLLPAIR